MDIEIDITPFLDFLNLPLHLMLWQIFWTVGWIPTAFVFLWGFGQIWMDYIQAQWSKNIKYVMLAIDIPRNNTQSPKAVENIFAYLAGAHSNSDLIGKYWTGEFQLSFSLEIVSIDGYTQFLVRTPEIHRNLVESSIYSQYPDAEITEVNDYTEGMPSRFPDDEYDVWGAEFIQANSEVYPIKTYLEFIDTMGLLEMQFKDPMASLMDLCSSLRKGEQLWFQLIVIPIGFDWAQKGKKEVGKILKEKVKSKRNIADVAIDGFLSAIGGISDAVYSLGAEEKKKEEEEPLKMMNLKPDDKRKVESIERKVSKVGFKFKARFVYIAKKEVFNKPKAAGGFVGFMKQFIDINLNNLKPDMDKTATSVSYFFKELRVNSRKNKIVRWYKKRDNTYGAKVGILNAEELATVWHFPVETAVKAPMIQKAPGRKAEPPSELPISLAAETVPKITEILSENYNGNSLKPSAGAEAKKEKADIFAEADKEDEEKKEVPENLPFIT